MNETDTNILQCLNPLQTHVKAHDAISIT